MKFKIVITLIFCLLPTIAMAEFQGEVIKIADGDTLTILTHEKQQVKVRLVEIDAPERKQAFGSKSRKALSAICFRKHAILKNTSKDRYDRILARIYCNGVDANAEMVRLGMAWVYDRYAHDKSLYELQEIAQSNSVGLWSDNSPTPPWEFRRKKIK